MELIAEIKKLIVQNVVTVIFITPLVIVPLTYIISLAFDSAYLLYYDITMCKSSMEYKKLVFGKDSYPNKLKKSDYSKEDFHSFSDSYILDLFKEEKIFVEKMTNLARGGYPKAQFYLALEIYSPGGFFFTKADRDKCMVWMSQAKNMRHPKADLSLC